MAHHDLKAFDGMFEGFVDGSYTCTIRHGGDRNFQPEDTITLREGYQTIDGFIYSGRTISFRISNVTDYGCVAAHMCLHLKDRNLLIIKGGVDSEDGKVVSRELG